MRVVLTEANVLVKVSRQARSPDDYLWKAAMSHLAELPVGCDVFSVHTAPLVFKSSC